MMLKWTRLRFIRILFIVTAIADFMWEKEGQFYQEISGGLSGNVELMIKRDF